MDLTALIEKKKAFQDAVKVEGANILKAEFAEFFAASPAVDAVRWKQYTPYFNDGEACVFGRQDFESRASAGDDFRDTCEHKYAAGSGRVAYDWKVQNAALEALGKKLGSGELDDVFLSAFGDHAEVTATREGFAVEECEHD